MRISDWSSDVCSSDLAAKSVEDPFLRKGIELAVDGTDPEELREILEAEIHSKKQEDKVASKFFGDMGGFSPTLRSEEHTSELHSLMRISYAVFCLKKKKKNMTPMRDTHTN